MCAVSGCDNRNEAMLLGTAPDSPHRIEIGVCQHHFDALARVEWASFEGAIRAGEDLRERQIFDVTAWSMVYTADFFVGNRIEQPDGNRLQLEGRFLGSGPDPSDLTLIFDEGLIERLRDFLVDTPTL